MSTRFAKVPEEAAKALLPRRPMLLRVYIAHRLASDFASGVSTRPAADIARELGSKSRDVSGAEKELEQLGLLSSTRQPGGRREVVFAGETPAPAKKPDPKPKAAKKPEPTSAQPSDARDRYNSRMREIQQLPEEERRQAFRDALDKLLDEEKAREQA